MSEPYSRYIIGDSLTVIGSLEDGSVDLVLTSPPFLALRSYLPPDHPDKAREMGSEPTPGEFIDALLDVVEAIIPKLAPHGSICVELGDTYAGSGGAGGDYAAEGLRAGQERFDGSKSRAYGTGAAPRLARVGRSDGWPSDKSLCLIPELFRVALVYGFNPLTGRQTPRWRARNVIRWCRPNPPVGALGDKVRPATSDMVIACLDRKRYFDLDAVRVPSDYERAPAARATAPGQKPKGCLDTVNPAGAPPLDHWWYDEEPDDGFDQDAWLISTQPYKGSHYATWPAALCEKPIKAMCPLRVCTTCGKPSERIVDVDYERSAGGTSGKRRDGTEPDGNERGMVGRPTMAKVTTTTGWTDCGHGTWRNGVVLDPFAGSGTTLAVATGLGRSAIGIDLDERNADLAQQRVGMWLEVEHHADEVVA